MDCWTCKHSKRLNGERMACEAPILNDNPWARTSLSSALARGQGVKEALAALRKIGVWLDARSTKRSTWPQSYFPLDVIDCKHYQPKT